MVLLSREWGARSGAPGVGPPRGAVRGTFSALFSRVPARWRRPQMQGTVAPGEEEAAVVIVTLEIPRRGGT